MPDEKVYDEPSEVDAKGGTVVVDGPDSVDVRLTPDAAAETSDRLLFAAAKARGQQLQEEQRRRGIRSAAERE